MLPILGRIQHVENLYANLILTLNNPYRVAPPIILREIDQPKNNTITVIDNRSEKEKTSAYLNFWTKPNILRMIDKDMPNAYINV